MRNDNIEKILEDIYKDKQNIEDIKIPDMNMMFNKFEQNLQEEQNVAHNIYKLPNRRWRFVKFGSVAAALIFIISIAKYTTFDDKNKDNIASINGTTINEKDTIKDKITPNAEKKENTIINNVLKNRSTETAKASDSKKEQNGDKQSDTKQNDNTSTSKIPVDVDNTNNNSEDNKDSQNQDIKKDTFADETSKHTNSIENKAIDGKVNLDFTFPRYIPSQYDNDKFTAYSMDKKVIEFLYKDSKDNTLCIIEHKIENNDEVTNIENILQDDNIDDIGQQMYETELININDCTIYMNKNGIKYYKAVWHDDKFNYIINAKVSLTKDEILKIIQGLQRQ